MARPYPAGGVSIAQSNPTCRRPAVPWPRAAFQQQQAYLPPVFPATSLLFPTVNHTGFRAKERRCGGEDRPWRSSSLHSH
jgi:hypothetical protein